MTYVLGVELSFCRCCVKMSGFGELLEHNTKLPYSVILVLKFILVLVFIRFSLNHFYFYIISVFSATIIFL